jgi:peptidoglycan/xylan/chitin deacetylase (PgdA/CDA1 family)
VLKHKLKMTLKRHVARYGLSTGAWRAANALSRKGRITLLTLHCVGYPEGTDYLPSYMKLHEKAFDDLLGRLAAAFDVISLHEALDRLAGGARGRNAVVVTLDDGYRDNYTHALPILKKHGVPATVFLETAAVDRRSLSWIQKFFFVDKQRGSEYIAHEYAHRTKDPHVASKLSSAAFTSDNVEYALKKILKYEVDATERESIFDDLFKALGGEDPALLDGAYLNWDEVRAMAEEGVTIGCHTMNHPILSTLTKEEARLEIREAKRLIEEKCGFEVDTFAYPWGRSWDFNDDTIEVLKEEGFVCGLAMDETSTIPGTHDAYRLSRFPLPEQLDLADLLAQASGLYAWFGGCF